MDQPIRIKADLTHRDPPAPGTGLRIALYQGEGLVGSVSAVRANLARMNEAAHAAAAYRSQVCVFPEQYVTGYALGVEELHELAEPCDGPSVEAARTCATTHGLALVLPYTERDGSKFYDSIAVIDAAGRVLTNYRKSHLYGAAERRNFAFGAELPPVLELNGFAVGILNCYECEIPPLYQYLAERGVKLTIGPTAADNNFVLADGRVSQVPYQDATRHIIPGMASVWRMFVAYSNRRGWETTPAGSWEYKANSGIWAPNGECVIAATPDDHRQDTLLIADCLAEAYPPFSPEGNHVLDNRLSLSTVMRDPETAV